ncbi:FkbM family methyltransferase [Methylobacterium sp. JK268]
MATTTPAMTHPHEPFGTYAPTGLVRWIVARTQRLPAEDWGARRLALILRRCAIRLLRGRPLDVERFGARMRLHPYNNNCEKKVLFTPQFFDPDERRLLAERLRPDCVFLDVGANIGAYTLFVAGLSGPGARILAVEPQPDIFDKLAYNIAQNPFGTVKAVACAIADKAGELTLFVDQRNSGESSLKVVGTNEGAAIRVPAVTLLDLVTGEGLTRIDAIKLDVEGAEDLILEPFLRRAPRALHPSLIILEDGTDLWQTDLSALLTSHGYRRMARTRLNLIFEKA